MITDATNSIFAHTSFTTDGAAVEEFAGVNWDGTSYSRISLLLGAGTYAITIAGDCAGGCSAGLGVRLDTATAAVIPEPASWAMMIAGFGLVGTAFRSRPLVPPRPLPGRRWPRSIVVRTALRKPLLVAANEALPTTTPVARARPRR